jgi:hypothetical protein
VKRTYGHLVRDAEDQDVAAGCHEDGQNGAAGHDMGTTSGDRDDGDGRWNEKPPGVAGLSLESG